MIVLWVFHRLVRKLVRKHGSGKGEWGREPERGGGGEMWRLTMGAPLARVPNSVNARGLLALNLLRGPRNDGFTTGHYLVVLQH